MTTTRHEFLARLHHLLSPRSYLEIGVHTGESLKLASCPAVGIDPAPQVAKPAPTARVFPVTSDEFFASQAETSLTDPIDLAFIDGMHLYEFALRDFIYVERHSNRKTVVVFDDVLPRNQGEAARQQCPGDWTGDVWKVAPILDQYRSDLSMCLVDTFPTGVLVVWGLDAKDETLSSCYETIIKTPQLADDTVPGDVLFRSTAISAADAIKRLKEVYL